MNQRVTRGKKASGARSRKPLNRKRRAAAGVRAPSDADPQALLARAAEQIEALTSELAAAREQQAAASDVLHTIASSHGGLAPVFQQLLENAVRLCEAKFGSMVLFEGSNYRRVGLYKAPPAYVEAMKQNPVLPISASVHLTRLLQSKKTLHIN